MINFKSLSRSDQKVSRERQEVMNMVESEGWKISFGKALERMKQMANVLNSDNGDEAMINQRALMQLQAFFEEVYGVVVTPEDFEEDIQDTEMYRVLGGQRVPVEDQF